MKWPADRVPKDQFPRHFGSTRWFNSSGSGDSGSVFMRQFLPRFVTVGALILSLQVAAKLIAQPPEFGPDGPPLPPEGRDPVDPEFRPRGPGGRGFGGPGGPGGPFQEERKLVAKFDLDKNGWLNAEERATARKETPTEPERRGPGGRGFRGPRHAVGPDDGPRRSRIRSPSKHGARQARRACITGRRRELPQRRAL